MPERMPVVDDARQLPMPFPNQDPGRDLLIHVIEVQSEALRHLAAINQHLLQNVQGNGHRPREPEPSARDHTGYGPSNPKHRTWRGFAMDMQRQVRELPSNVKPTKTNVASHGSDTVRAINYAMLGYGLDLRDWPPDRWDAEQDHAWRSPKRPKTRQI